MNETQQDDSASNTLAPELLSCSSGLGRAHRKSKLPHAGRKTLSGLLEQMDFPDIGRKQTATKAIQEFNGPQPMPKVNTGLPPSTPLRNQWIQQFA